MLSQVKFRPLLFAFFTLCIFVRLIFVFATEQIPVMWDARIYSSAALGMIHFAGNADRFGHPELDSKKDLLFNRAQFDLIMKKYIDGEQIEWLYYKIPTVAEAQDNMFLSGPVYPIYLAAVFLASPSGDFSAVRILNTIIDGFCLVLVMLICASLFGRNSALIAGILYIFYLPLILLTGFVSPEPLTIFLILLSLYVIVLWYEKQRPGYAYLSGLALGLLVLTRPTATLLFVPFLIGVLYDSRMRVRAILPLLWRVIIPFFVVVIPWLIVASLYFGQLTIRDPEYSTANIRSSSSIKYEGYDLDHAEEDFWLWPVMYTIKKNPLGYGKLLLKKFVRLWSQPYNDFNQAFILNTNTGRLYHLIIVLTGLFGVFYFAINSRKGSVFILLIPLYYTLIHIVFHSLARYNLASMPLVIIASSGIILHVWKFFWELSLTRGIGLILIRLLLLLGGVSIILFFPERYAIELLGVRAGITALLLIKVVILGVMFFYLLKILSGRLGNRSALKVCTAPAVLLLAILVFLGSAPEGWAEWKCRLEDKSRAAGVRIYVPKDFKLQPGELVRIGIDMVTNKGRKNAFTVSLNGRSKLFHVNEPPISDSYYRKMTYDVFESMFDIGEEEMRAWRFIPMMAEVFNSLIAETGFIEITLRIDDSQPESENYVDLFGNYNITGDRQALIPCLTHSSIERFIEKGDPRMWVNYKLSSDSAISYYIDDVGRVRVDKDDLSPSPGRQSGRCRIFVEVKRLDEVRHYF